MSDLMNTYEQLRQRYDEPMGGPNPVQQSKPLIRSVNPTNPKMHAFRSQLSKEGERMREECCKRILLDIYMRTLPLDEDYVRGNMGMFRDDIDRMLTSRGMTALQYFQSAYNETKAPLLEYVLRSVDAVVGEFREDAEIGRVEADKRNMNLPVPTVAEEDIERAVADITSDAEYENFIEVLKKKTIDRIVDDVSRIIERDPITPAKPTPIAPRANLSVESASPFEVAMNHAVKLMTKINPDKTGADDPVLATAMRESCMYTIGMVMGLEDGNMKQFESKLSLNKGVLITESGIRENFHKLGGGVVGIRANNLRSAVAISRNPNLHYEVGRRANRNNPPIDLTDLYIELAEKTNPCILITVDRLYNNKEVPPNIYTTSNVLGSGYRLPGAPQYIKSRANKVPMPANICFMQILTSDLPNQNVFGEGVKVVQLLTDSEGTGYEFVTSREIPTDSKSYPYYWDANPWASDASSTATLKFTIGKQFVDTVLFVDYLVENHITAEVNGRKVEFTREFVDTNSFTIDKSLDSKYHSFEASINGMAFPIQSMPMPAKLCVPSSLTGKLGERIGDNGCIWVNLNGKADWDCG